MTHELKHVLSAGVGTQSSTLALMAELGEVFPKPVCGVFADTKDEPQSVYDYLPELQLRLSFPIHVVGKDKPLSKLAATVRKSKTTGLNYLKHSIPVFMKRASGKRGMMQRQCTLDTKIAPVRNFIRDEVVGKKAYLAWRKRHKSALKTYNEAIKLKQPVSYEVWTELQGDALACVWIGISTDEADRAKDSTVPWIVNRFPLLEMNMSRTDCLKWCAEKGLPIPPKSSCRYCPYHHDDEWIRLRDNEPEEFQKAVEFELEYQKAVAQCQRLDGVPYFHESLVPLSEAKFIPGKSSPIAQSPCEGMCGR
jgi:hypothetical protein